MKIVKKMAVAAGVLASLVWGQQAAAGLIDNNLGDLNDWLLNTPTGSELDWIVADSQTKFFIDDWDRSGSGFLDPGWGGQAYDAEAIYVAIDDEYLHVAVITGLSPDTAAHRYPAGDIAIDLNYDENASAQSYDMAIVVKDHSGWSAGDLLDVSDWNYGLWSDSRVQGGGTDFYYNHPTRASTGVERTGSSAGQVSYEVAKYDGVTYGRNDDRKLGEYDDGNDAHYLIEALIPRELFFESGSGTDLLTSGAFFVHWTMGCNNDFVGVDPLVSSNGGSVPIAPAWSLMFLGLAGLAGSRKRG